MMMMMIIIMYLLLLLLLLIIVMIIMNIFFYDYHHWYCNFISILHTCNKQDDIRVCLKLGCTHKMAICTGKMTF